MKKESSPSLSVRLEESARYIRSKSPLSPRIGIILGSGLGDFAKSLSDSVPVDTTSIPHYPRSTVQGHRGKIVFGTLHGVPLVVLQGRVHFYETNDLQSILYPIH